MDSSIRQPNAIVDYWKTQDDIKGVTTDNSARKLAFQADPSMDSPFLDNQPAEEGIVRSGKKKSEQEQKQQQEAFGGALVSTVNRRKVNSVFEYENLSK